jgi:hypothetical protein
MPVTQVSPSIITYSKADNPRKQGCTRIRYQDFIAEFLSQGGQEIDLDARKWRRRCWVQETARRNQGEILFEHRSCSSANTCS